MYVLPWVFITSFANKLFVRMYINRPTVVKCKERIASTNNFYCIKNCFSLKTFIVKGFLAALLLSVLSYFFFAFCNKCIYTQCHPQKEYFSKTNFGSILIPPKHFILQLNIKIKYIGSKCVILQLCKLFSNTYQYSFSYRFLLFYFICSFIYFRKFIPRTRPVWILFR